MNTTKESKESNGWPWWFQLKVPTSESHQILGSWNTTCWNLHFQIFHCWYHICICPLSTFFIFWDLVSRLRKRCSAADNLVNWMGSWVHIFTPAAWLKYILKHAKMCRQCSICGVQGTIANPHDFAGRCLSHFRGLYRRLPCRGGCGWVQETWRHLSSLAFDPKKFCIVDFNLRQTFDVSITSDSDPACVCHIR